MTLLDTRLDALLEQRKVKGRFRMLREYDTSGQSSMVDFSSNDYLSMTSSQTFRNEYLTRLSSASDIFGSTGSRLLSGSTASHSALENRFANLFASPSALLFNSGWDANVSFFSTVPQPSDWVVYDELVHASVHSGLRASRVPPSKRVAFKHNDPGELRKVLEEIMNKPGSSLEEPVVYLALESLYSMDGDMAPLPDFLHILDDYIPRVRQCVVLDEAHSTGVYGQQGRGVAHALGEEGGWGDVASTRGLGRVGVRLMTFGKAVGCSGAVLLCSPSIRSFLINFARPFIFSTALPHSTLISLQCAWDILESHEGDHRRQTLMTLCTYFHSLLAPLLAHTPPHILRLPPPSPAPFRSNRCGLPPRPSTPIIGLLTPEPHALSRYLLDQGSIVRPVVPPTVPPGEERVRICLRVDMKAKAIDKLVHALEAWAKMKAQERRGSRSIAPEVINATKARL